MDMDAYQITDGWRGAEDALRAPESDSIRSLAESAFFNVVTGQDTDVPLKSRMFSSRSSSARSDAPAAAGGFTSLRLIVEPHRQ
ncbi:MAG: hypothetical protein CME15_08015 [Gemmatimonadetes bacterium]|jgi:hypothetical protein|nr:hypothetical protein [Gemmatimonadota bacterium]